MEEWKSIIGFEDLYEVSSEGRVRSLNYNHTGEMRILKQMKDKDGYLLVTLCKNGEKKSFLVHRLVAIAFIPNPFNKPQINHKNEDKTKNSVDCLEWVSRSENINYGTRNERVAKALSRPVQQFTKDGIFVTEFPSAHEAERQTGIFQSNIVACLKGNLKSTGGYVWKYKLLR